MGPEDLAQVLRLLPPAKPDPNLLVGTETFDDAGVYRLSEELALVQTLDFFTPVVDDPFTFGQIAAANALSDVYAMGAKPLTALNLVAFPGETLEKSVLAEILKGGMAKVDEAKAVLVGGHTVDDPEPKYGLAVTGIVHPERVVTNAGARPGDRLILTKPLGIGVITTAMKRTEVSQEVAQGAVETMCALNASASEAMQAVGVHACTDVTGFGLLGHLHEMALASGVAARVNAEAVPLLPGARELAEAGNICGGSRANLRYLEPFVRFGDHIDETTRILLADAITSGGLLISVAEEKAPQLVEALKARGTLTASEIGSVAPGEAGQIAVA